jgi:Ohr subfamily peroxiredoxin
MTATENVLKIRPLYTAETTVTGGRAGHARSSDGRLDLDLSVPTEQGGEGGPGTNPEQLFAAGYSACFQSALGSIARRHGVTVEDTEIRARVSVGPVRGSDTQFGLKVELHVHFPTLKDAALQKELVEGAHERCPYSNATRGNIEVDLSWD